MPKQPFGTFGGHNGRAGEHIMVRNLGDVDRAIRIMLGLALQLVRRETGKE